MICIGIDSGLDGAIVAIESSTFKVMIAEIVPTVRASAKSGRRAYDLRAMLDIVDGAGAGAACLEHGGVRPGEGPTGAWKVGYGFAVWETALVAARLTYETPTPQAWQRDVFRGVNGDGKERAVMACRRLLPGLDLTPGRRVKPHTGLADAACIAIYACRRLGGRT